MCNCNSAWHRKVPRLKFDKDYFYRWSFSNHVFQQAILQNTSGTPFRVSHKHSTTVYNLEYISFLMVLNLCKCLAQSYTIHQCSLSFKLWLLILKITEFSELLLVMPSVLFICSTPEHISTHIFIQNMCLHRFHAVLQLNINHCDLPFIPY
jgi:hypothetical protein